MTQPLAVFVTNEPPPDEQSRQGARPLGLLVYLGPGG